MKNINENVYKDFFNGNINKWEYIQKMYETHAVLFRYAKDMRNTNIRKIEITDGRVVMTTRDYGIKLEAGELDERCVPIEMLNFGDYEKDEWDMMTKILKTAEVKSAFDIGANMGYISFLLKKKFPNILITAFEPIKKTFNILLNNISYNQEEIKAVHMGLSDEKGVFTYYYYPEGSGNASLMNVSNRRDVVEIRTDVTTLDLYVKDHNVEKIDFIKIDVEGAEFKVLKGGIFVIKNFKPILYLELLRKWSAPFGYHPNDVLKWLAEIGYGCYVIIGDKIARINKIDDATVETNFVCLHEEKHKMLIEYYKEETV